MTAHQAWYGEAIASFAALTPTAPALVMPDRTVSFAQANRAIEGIAAALHGRGLQPGQPVALVVAMQGIDLMLMHACHRLGAPILVLSPGDSPAIARGLVDAAGARLVLTTGVPVPADVGVPVLRVERDWLTADPAGLPPPPGPEAPCYLGRSSGTTSGVPKLVATSHASETGRVATTLTRFPLGPDDRFLAVIAFHYAFGRAWCQRSLMRGASLAIPGALVTVDDLADAVREYGATWLALTPSHVQRLLAGWRSDGQLLPGVRLFVGSAPLSPSDRRAVLRRITGELYILYGTNEVGTLSIAVPEEIRRNPLTAGRPDPAIEIEIVDADGLRCPPRTVGLVRARSDAFPDGYRRINPGATSRFIDGWFYPGDFGFLEADGQLVLRGRADDQMSVGGRKIYPSEIEECLSGHPAVAEVVALGIPHKELGDEPVAAVVLHTATSATDLLGHCRAALGRDGAPRRVVVLDAMPKTDMGKPDRRALRRMLDAS
ncbi:MAG: class I adenylate-forming enzyme family protein [Alphaproteobacteria bacterium]